MLKQKDLADNQRTILLYTIEEKQTLATLIKFANWAIDVLLMKPAEAIKQLESEVQSGYIKIDLLPLLKREKQNGNN